MSDGTFVEKIVATSQPLIQEINELTYSSKPMSLVGKPMPVAMTAHTLKAVVDYMKSMAAGDNASPSVHVVAPDEVHLVANLDGNHRTREKYLVSELISTQFQFNKYVPVEEFIIQLQAMFCQDEVTSQILMVVGNLKTEASKTSADDGCTQVVTTRRGVSGVVLTSVPNPVTLRPYRTFPEIVQPASKFVFRMKDTDANPVCALFEADGGQWKLEAIRNISAFLAGELPAATIIA